MATYVPPKRATAYTTYISLVSQADTDLFQTTVTLAAGDVTVSKDGGAFNNIATLPTEIGTSGVLEVALSATEMTADTVVVRFRDAAGDEWCDALLVLHALSTTIGDATLFPAGAIEFTYTVIDAATGNPIEGAEVWFSTDAGGANVVWKGDTDAFGIAMDVNGDLPWLDAGTYYVWSQLGGYYFSNPDIEVVS